MTYPVLQLAFHFGKAQRASLHTNASGSGSLCLAFNILLKGWSLIYSNCLLVVGCGPTGFFCCRELLARTLSAPVNFHRPGVPEVAWLGKRVCSSKCEERDPAKLPPDSYTHEECTEA